MTIMINQGSVCVCLYISGITSFVHDLFIFFVYLCLFTGALGVWETDIMPKRAVESV